MSVLLNAIKNSGQNVKSNIAYTANNAVSLASTTSKVLDFFATGGALRNQSDNVAVDMFKSAFFENAELTLKCLFYLRDCRGGMGERKVFRNVLQWLGNEYPDIVSLNLTNIVEFGRFDDLYSLFGTASQDMVLSFIKDIIVKDLEAYNKKEPVSLAFKWIAACNASSPETRAHGHIIRKYLNLSEREYRKTLSSIRNYLNIVERDLCTKNYTHINYNHVPSRAGLIYRNAFKKHDLTRYVTWQSDVKSGKNNAKVNTAVLYPYDIIREVRAGRSGNDTLDLQWNNLPNYFKNNNSTLVLCDTSGSMSSGLSGNVQPLDVSISLAIYCGERAKGPFKNHFITFSSVPTLQEIVGKNIYEKVNNLSHAHWSMNTDLQAAFDLILNTALKNKLSQEDLPSTLLIISDLAFDACRNNSLTNFETVKRKFELAGYTLPKVVFWRVNTIDKQQPVQRNEINIALISGLSPSIIQYLFDYQIVTPYQQMLKVLNNERYSIIKVPDLYISKDIFKINETVVEKNIKSKKTSSFSVTNISKKLQKITHKRDELGRFAK